MIKLDLQEAVELAKNAVLAAGADERTALSLAKATVEAEVANHPSVGFAHLFDYLDGFSAGRIARSAQPLLEYPTPTLIQVDADKGIGQLGFELVFNKFVERVQNYGIGLFLQSNSYTVGELGYYTRKLSNAGLLAMACSNGPAMTTTSNSREPVYGTNPLSFSAPLIEGESLVIDQASSAAAFVKIRDAALCGEPIPEGWALDAHGEPTLDAQQALKGMLLTFGGERGANIALMVEVLTAGLTGANWSLNVPAFQSGTASPCVGLCIVAISPKLIDPQFSSRLTEQLNILQAKGIYIPGRLRKRNYITIPKAILLRLKAK